MTVCATPRAARYFRPRWRTLLAAVWVALPSAQAAEGQFSWSAPARCATASEVAAAVLELTGRPLPTLPPDQRIQGVVEHRANSWALSLTMHAGTQPRSRVITAPTCDELVRAAAVAVALALDRDPDAEALALDEPPIEPAPAQLVPAATSTAPDVAGPVDDTSGPDLPASQRSMSALEWQLELGGLLDASALAEPSPGLELALGARSGRLEGMAYGAWLPAQHSSLESGGSVALGLIAGGLRACYRLVNGVIGASACGSVEVGRLEAQGEGLENSASYSDWWLAPSLALALDARLTGPLYLRGSVGAVIPLLRETYRVEESAYTHRAASVGWRGELALGIAFGRPD